MTREPATETPMRVAFSALSAELAAATAAAEVEEGEEDTVEVGEGVGLCDGVGVSDGVEKGDAVTVDEGVLVSVMVLVVEIEFETDAVLVVEEVALKTVM